MGVTALEIYKYLPKTNCKKCGLPTCLAFAMKLAAKQIELSRCPYISEEAKLALEAMAEPPQRCIEISSPKRKVKVGGELVLFRHEKKFYNPTGLGVIIDTKEELEGIKDKIREVQKLEFERVGQIFKVDFIAIKDSLGNLDKFLSLIESLKEGEQPLILISTLKNLRQALPHLNGHRPLLYPLDVDDPDQLYELAKEGELPIAVKGGDLARTFYLAERIREKGFKDIVLDLSAKGFCQLLTYNTVQRRLAILKNKKFASFPIMGIIQGDEFRKLGLLAIGILKYSDILLTDTTDRAFWYPLITLRFNIYTDPQKPVTVEPKLYSIGKAGKDSPLLVTTNFSLTYYTVAPEVENSKIPSYLLVVDTEGMSVLTAWAADKFNAEVISDWMKKERVEEFLSHRKVIIPGYVAVLSGKLEDLTGWEVIVGPKEATGIPKFLREIWR